MSDTTTDTDSIDLDDLKDLPRQLHNEVRSNNETVTFYLTPDRDQLGVIRHNYDGFPALGTVLFDVTGYEIVDYELVDVPDGETPETEFDHFSQEIHEWIDQQLTERVVEGRADIDYVDHHKYSFEDPYEGDVFVIELETTNKRRVR